MIKLVSLFICSICVLFTNRLLPVISVASVAKSREKYSNTTRAGERLFAQRLTGNKQAESDDGGGGDVFLISSVLLADVSRVCASVCMWVRRGV